MQDVSCEPLMLRPSENPQASLDIFSQPIITPQGSCIYRKAINKNNPLSCWMVSYYRQDCHMQGRTVYFCLSPWRGW